MSHKTTITSTSTTTAMGNGNKKPTSNSFSADNLSKHSLRNIDKHVSKWSSTEVQHWIKQQCKKFELKKITAEKFEMNGQALVLLSKNDFVRRASDGGEVLYYALQQLISPNKVNSTRLDQNVLKNRSSSQHARIVEVAADSEEANRTSDLSSPKPIVEEPDDPPIIRSSHSETHHNNQHEQRNNYRYFANQPHIPSTVYTMPADVAAAYFYQQQQGLPNAFMYAHQPNLHMHQHPHFFHPHLIHQYYPMMSAQGILIEIMDDAQTNVFSRNGIHNSMNGVNFGVQEPLYLVTMNGQRYIMNEREVRQLVIEVYQRENYQANLQQQQRQRNFPEQQRS